MTVLSNILDSSDTVTVNNKQFQVNIANGLPKVYHPSSGYVLDRPHYTDHAVKAIRTISNTLAKPLPSPRPPLTGQYTVVFSMLLK